MSSICFFDHAKVKILERLQENKNTGTLRIKMQVVAVSKLDTPELEGCYYSINDTPIPQFFNRMTNFSNRSLQSRHAIERSMLRSYLKTPAGVRSFSHEKLCELRNAFSKKNLEIGVKEIYVGYSVMTFNLVVPNEEEGVLNILEGVARRIKALVEANRFFALECKLLFSTYDPASETTELEVFPMREASSTAAFNEMKERINEGFIKISRDE